MNAAGLLLWALALLALLGTGVCVVLWRGGAVNPASRLERTYLILSFATLPLAMPVMLHRLLPLPGPEIPAALTLLALVRTFLGVLLALIGVGLSFWLLGRGRTPSWVVLAALANLLPFVVLAWPRP